MSRDLPIQFPSKPESALTLPNPPSPAQKSRHLSAIPGGDRLTRGQVAERLGVSISTVRRYEGTQLHPTIDENDVRWFAQAEVTALAARIANERSDKPSRAVGSTASAPKRSAGELAALVFERFEQRQSLAEIVIGLRVEPSTVHGLFDQWCVGLTEQHLRTVSEPRVARECDMPRASPAELARLLDELARDAPTRISVGRYRGTYLSDNVEFADIVELGGFHAAGGCTLNDLTRRFGPGDFRITAYRLTPPALLWEVSARDIE